MGPVPSWLVQLFVFAIGAMIGSFLNVCIYRMPREQSIVWPGSRCPHCEHPIAWYDNIPVVSFLALHAACRHCQQPIRWRYPLVELLTGLVSIAVVRRFGLTPIGLVDLVFVYGLIVISFIDVEFQIIPDEISLGGLAFGLVVSGMFPALHATDSRWLALGRSLVGAVVGAGLLYGIGVVGDFVFRKESMGMGDVKLLAMAGSLLGWKLVVLTFFLSPMIALIPGLIVMFWKRSHVIPYGPFLSLGLVVSLFVGQDLLRVTGIEETIRFLWEFHFGSGRV